MMVPENSPHLVASDDRVFLTISDVFLNPIKIHGPSLQPVTTCRKKGELSLPTSAKDEQPAKTELSSFITEPGAWMPAFSSPCTPYPDGVRRTPTGVFMGIQGICLPQSPCTGQAHMYLSRQCTPGWRGKKKSNSNGISHKASPKEDESWFMKRF